MDQREGRRPRAACRPIRDRHGRSFTALERDIRPRVEFANCHVADRCVSDQLVHGRVSPTETAPVDSVSSFDFRRRARDQAMTGMDDPDPAHEVVGMPWRCAESALDPWIEDTAGQLITEDVRTSCRVYRGIRATDERSRRLIGIGIEQGWFARVGTDMSERSPRASRRSLVTADVRAAPPVGAGEDAEARPDCWSARRSRREVRHDRARFAQ